MGSTTTIKTIWNDIRLGDIVISTDQRKGYVTDVEVEDESRTITLRPISRWKIIRWFQIKWYDFKYK